MKQSRAKSHAKLVSDNSYEVNTETVFKHYDNKFFDMDEFPKNSLEQSIPVPNMELQELQQYVTKCYDELYESFNEFKSSIMSQLHSLQEEVHTLSFHNSSKNDGVVPQAVRESSPSPAFNDIIQGRIETWGTNKSQEFKNLEGAQFHHESRLQQHTESRSQVKSKEPCPETKPLYHPANDEEERLIEHIPAGAWSSSSSHRASSTQKHPTESALEKRQDPTYLSRHLQGSHPPRKDHRNELWPEMETREYNTAEQENEQAIEKMVSEYNNHKKRSNTNAEMGGGRDRFTLHGWAASFLQQTAMEGQLANVNKHIVKQETTNNDKERLSSQHVKMELTVAEMEITTKRPSKGSSSSQDMKQARNTTHTYLNSSIKPEGKRQQQQQQPLTKSITNVANSDPKFPGKKCRGGIAWAVDELAEQNKQRAQVN